MCPIVSSLFESNIFTKGTVEVLCRSLGFMKGGIGAMVTYSDLFAFVIMLCAVITLVVTLFCHKK